MFTEVRLVNRSVNILGMTRVVKLKYCLFYMLILGKVENRSAHLFLKSSKLQLVT